MAGRGNRTFICSVAFLDIVDYSRKPVAEQIRLKERLNAALAEALEHVAVSDRIVLDTGDGAAISFVGDPEDALFLCLALRDSLKSAPAGAGPALSLRFGINLGPVKVVRDLNGQPNIIGDGINVAQRVMGFAAPGQILVSRSYYEVVSCLSDAFARLFRYEGSRTDKHVREHELYAVGEEGEEIRRQLAREPAEARTGAAALARSAAQRVARTGRWIAWNLRARPPLGTAAAVAAILALSLLLRALKPAEAPPPAASGAPVAALEPPAPAAAPAGPEAAAPAGPAEAPPEPAAPPPVKKKRAPAAFKLAPPAEKPRPPRAWEAPRAEPAPAPSLEPGTLVFQVIPWGEIYIDGKKRGVSPPLREIEVRAGWHRIEVRNADFPAYVDSIEVEPGARIRIRHRFR